MDVLGVAIATWISTLFSALAVLVFLGHNQGVLHLDLHKLTLFCEMGDIFWIGLPASFENMIMWLSAVYISKAINGFDELVISGNSASTSIEGLMAIGFVGFSTAAGTFVAQNYGAKDFKRVWKSAFTALGIALALGELLGFLVIYFRSPLIAFYTNVGMAEASRSVIIESGATRLFYMGILYGLCGTMNVLGGCTRGLGSTKVPLVISILTSCVFRLTWIFTYAAEQGTIEAIYVVYPLSWILSTVLNGIWFVVLAKHQEKEIYKEIPKV